MKARLIFKVRDSVALKFGGRLTINMDLYQINDEHLGFERAYTFSWIAFDPKDPDNRVLMDQHSEKPCHLHLDGLEINLDPSPLNLDEAIKIFWNEVRKHFGELLEAP